MKSKEIQSNCDFTEVSHNTLACGHPIIHAL